MPADEDQGDSRSPSEPRLPSERRPPARDKSFSDLLNEFVGMVITYVKQETLDPIKALQRFLVYGFAGALVISVGWVVLSLTVTRLLQAEAKHHLSGSLTWVPYLAGLLTAAAGVAWALSRIMKEQK